MKALKILCMMFWLVSAYGQTTPPVSFVYDKDGNMTARNVVRAPGSTTKSATDAGNSKYEEPEQKVYSVLEGEQVIRIYPNPTSGNFMLGVTLLDSRLKNYLLLYDALGHLLLTVQIKQEMTLVEIKGPPGIYLMDIHLGGNVSKWKIIKE